MTKGRQDTPEYRRNKPLVLARDDFTCVYCGREATTCDHVVPWSISHDDSMENLVASCLDCNLRKGDREWVRGSWWDHELLDHL